MKALHAFPLCVLAALVVGGGCASTSTARWVLTPSNPTTNAPFCAQLPLSLASRAALSGPKSSAALLKAQGDQADLAITTLTLQLESANALRTTAEAALKPATEALTKAQAAEQSAQVALRTANLKLQQADHAISELARTTDAVLKTQAQEALDAERLRKATQADKAATLARAAPGVKLAAANARLQKAQAAHSAAQGQSAAAAKLPTSTAAERTASDVAVQAATRALDAATDELRQATAAQQRAAAIARDAADVEARAHAMLDAAKQASSASKNARVEAEAELKALRDSEAKLPADVKKAHADAEKVLNAARKRKQETSEALWVSQTDLTDAQAQFRLATQDFRAADGKVKTIEQALGLAKTRVVNDPAAAFGSPLLCVADTKGSTTHFRLTELNTGQQFMCVRVRSPHADVLGYVAAGDKPDRSQLELRPVGGVVELMLAGDAPPVLTLKNQKNVLNQVLASAPELDELSFELFTAACRDLCELAQPAVTLRFQRGLPEPRLETRSEDSACPLALSRAAARDESASETGAGGDSGGNGGASGGSANAAGTAGAATGGAGGGSGGNPGAAGAAAGGPAGTGGGGGTAGSGGSAGGAAHSGGSGGSGGTGGGHP